ncbi:hypothetical protein Skr01_57200 [Sphaerisporangium krabiense]|uniref:Uncharacterized protein n=1 Tax=Sphaerisporangium krabiense TaxID=763782 RepID=A0A7W9DSH1_9ACTN|nr:hypothetical protein [Sphaerisporangium krabiense]MBB5629513.1 hypothetical protein [Sphaerisporangium krabiense]GII65635.1 hypothetical protein Skr01_57200 [Sphaerisporangium krabiense]
MADILFRVAVIVLIVSVVRWGWRKVHPVSYWLLVGYPLRLIGIYATWRAVAAGCGLARRRRRFRWTFPGLGG